MSLHKGAWEGPRILDLKPASYINAYFEDSPNAGAPVVLQDNDPRVFKGPFFLGDGFLLTHREAERLRLVDPKNAEVIFLVISAQEINNQPDQKPGRSIINFFDWPKEKARHYTAPFERVQELVKPIRDRDNRAVRRERWWQYAERASGLYAGIASLIRCFVVARHTKHLSFSEVPTNYVFSDALCVFTTDRWDLYAVVQSALHEVWARKYSGALETRLRYSPSDCFDTFAFPEGLRQTDNPALAAIGERYHEHRKSLMVSLWLGLTDIYNLFHARDLTPAKVVKVSKKSAEEAVHGSEGLLELRRLHVELDLAIRDAYGWQNLPLDHDFHEVETLPENDRVRYTISPAARKEVLRRLLALNHARAEAEKAAGGTNKPKRGKKTQTPDDEHIEMFAENPGVPSN